MSVIFCGMFIHYHWDAELITNLATRKIVLPFKDLDDLLKHSDHKLILPRGTALLDRFRYAKDDIRSRL